MEKLLATARSSVAFVPQVPRVLTVQHAMEKLNCFGVPYVASHDLASKDIPQSASDWRSMIEFAAKLDLESEKPSTHIRGVKEQSDNWTIADLRYSLYAEWRRFNHFGYDPDPITVGLVQNVLDTLRTRLS